jgi:ABC-type phosphate transport system permease subunit
MGVGLLFALTGITVLPVIGLLIAVPVLVLAVVFLAAPRSKACAIIAQKTRGALNN